MLRWALLCGLRHCGRMLWRVKFSRVARRQAHSPLSAFALIGRQSAAPWVMRDSVWDPLNAEEVEQLPVLCHRTTCEAANVSILMV